MKDCEDRSINVPSWSLSICMINKVIVIAEKEGRSQSSIVKEALEEWFEKHSPTQEE